MKYSSRKLSEEAKCILYFWPLWATVQAEILLMPSACVHDFIPDVSRSRFVSFLLSFLALSGAAVGKRPPRDRLRAGQQWEVKAVSLNLISRLLISSHLWSNWPCREVKLSVVSYLTNSIVDQILQELYATHKTLVRAQHTWDGRFSFFSGPTEVNWGGRCVCLRLGRCPIWSTGRGRRRTGRAGGSTGTETPWTSRTRSWATASWVAGGTLFTQPGSGNSVSHLKKCNWFNHLINQTSKQSIN